MEQTADAHGNGSSPRMRGKHGEWMRAYMNVGLIPAHAGKTWCAGEQLRRYRAHPRACGENLSRNQTRTQLAGSSPRMRGKPPRSSTDPRRSGLIPAHAGKTLRPTDHGMESSAHPRACGENSLNNTLKPAVSGSSPRMRGKRNRGVILRHRARLIPAHAGKTCGDRDLARCTAAHPRACGENIFEQTADAQGAGSSPRMRGKLP